MDVHLIQRSLRKFFITEVLWRAVWWSGLSQYREIHAVNHHYSSSRICDPHERSLGRQPAIIASQERSLRHGPHQKSPISAGFADPRKTKQARRLTPSPRKLSTDQHRKRGRSLSPYKSLEFFQLKSGSVIESSSATITTRALTKNAQKLNVVNLSACLAVETI